MLKARRGHRGMTLIELIVVVSIVGIIAAIGLPSFRQLIVSQRIKAAASDLHASLTQARSEALKRNTSVSLTPVQGNQWSTGWKIVDPSDATRSLLQSAALSGVTITGPVSVTYLSSGRVSGSTATFELSSAQTSDVRCVSINLSGTPTVRKAAC